MITEDYISRETAILLKEKGFHEPVRFEYHYDNTVPSFHRHLKDFNGAEYEGKESQWYSAPTYQMAMKWLKESHGIFILIKPYDSYYDEKYEFSIYKKPNTVIFEWELLETENSLYEGYEETVEAAIKYSLENLV